MSFLDQHRDDLDRLARIGRERRLVARSGYDFASNDYLGLAQSGELKVAIADAISRGVPAGSGGSRLLRGNHPEHEALEAEAAVFFGSDSALFFSSGYAANSTLMATLPQTGDRIFFDALVHASCHDGMRLSRASIERVAHNDADDFDRSIARWRTASGTGRPWIVVESIYSMDGDRAPVEELMAVARRHGALLVIDEAHATGVFGPGGRGLAAALQGSDQVITVNTCGKALGCEGALVCGPRIMRDFLINRGRGFIFSTAPSPLVAAAVRAALHLILDDRRRERLGALIAHAAGQLVPLGANATGSQIMPLILGGEQQTMELAGRLRNLGFDVRGIRPPTVPEGTSRLRISLTLNVDETAVDRLAESLKSLP